MSTNVEGIPKLSTHRVLRDSSVRYASDASHVGGTPPGFAALATRSTSMSPAASNSRSPPSLSSCPPLPNALNTNLQLLTGVSADSAAANCGYGDTKANALPVVAS